MIGLRELHHPDPQWLDWLTLGILILGIPVWIYNFLVGRQRRESMGWQVLNAVMVVWITGSSLAYAYLLRT
jgi:hypothetical protein